MWMGLVAIKILSYLDTADLHEIYTTTVLFLLMKR